MIYYTCPPFDFCTKSCKMGSNFTLSSAMGPMTKVRQVSELEVLIALYWSRLHCIKKYIIQKQEKT